VDWREAFIKYINIVGDAEGVDFLRADDWTQEEWAAVNQAAAEAYARYSSQPEAGPTPS
jgi:hypothetical protein